MNIGILGGTFDPIHLGHLMIAEQVRQELSFEQIWFMPTNSPPHKQEGPAATARQRLEMVELAIKDNAYFRVEDIEIRRGGTTYTFDTMTELRSLYPSYTFHYLIGGDMVAYLPKWHRIDELLELVHFVGLLRPGYESAWDQLPEGLRDKVSMIAAPLIDISSTMVRSRAAHGWSIRYCVPDAVDHYIRENRLYV